MIHVSQVQVLPAIYSQWVGWAYGMTVGVLMYLLGLMLIQRRLTERPQCQCFGCHMARHLMADQVIMDSLDDTSKRRRGGRTGAIVIAVAAVALVAGLASSPASAQQSPQTTFRNSSGSTIGTATTSNGGSGVTSTFRDAGGRTTGTATTTPGGQTIYRDAGGRTTGTSSSPRR